MVGEKPPGGRSVWLIIYRKETKIPSVYYPEAVEEALCFGWIDSKGNKRDDKVIFNSLQKETVKVTGAR